MDKIFPNKGISDQKQKKVNVTIGICAGIRIIVGTKFQLKLIVLSFWNEFGQKEHFWSETKKVNTAFEFHISRYQISASTDNFDFLNQIYPKKGISDQKQKK